MNNKTRFFTFMIVAVTFAFLLAVGGCAPAPKPGEPSLMLDKNAYAPGEMITVTFTASPSYPTNAWVGIIPSDVPHGDETVNDQHDMAYQYLDGMTAGTLMFNAPTAPGSYDIRMHDTDSGGVEVASVTFKVK